MVRALETRCCVVGGGPAGVMLGYLLARAGVDVVVLEKHADFLRDFRGDTIHPSTLEVLRELGLLEAFLALPHRKVQVVRGIVGGEAVTIADFRRLSVHSPFVALVPQWDFLELLVERASAYETFTLLRSTEATDVLSEGDSVVGVRARDGEGELEIRADLVVGADGRHSTLRDRARLPVRDLGAPIDVLWMRLSRRPTDPAEVLGRFETGGALVLLDRGSSWQCGFVIAKGRGDAIRGEGLERFRGRIAGLAPFLRDRVGELDDWAKVKLLTVAVDRLVRWHRPGLLCIGDAAHAMSPVGGVGINLAIQDAVATANLLAAPLRRGRSTEADLARVQRRRELPARVTQRLQVFLHERFLGPVLGGVAPRAPWFVRLLDAVPPLQRIPARLIGLGIRPEHVRLGEVAGWRELEPTAHARAA